MRLSEVRRAKPEKHTSANPQSRGGGCASDFEALKDLHRWRMPCELAADLGFIDGRRGRLKFQEEGGRAKFALYSTQHFPDGETFPDRVFRRALSLFEAKEDRFRP